MYLKNSIAKNNKVLIDTWWNVNFMEVPASAKSNAF